MPYLRSARLLRGVEDVEHRKPWRREETTLSHVKNGLVERIRERSDGQKEPGRCEDGPGVEGSETYCR